MSFPLKELARLLASDTALLGAVVAIEGAVIRVATERGAMTARSLDTLAVGDRVWVRNGIAMRAPVARQSYPV
jgi:hypothetical protein